MQNKHGVLLMAFVCVFALVVIGACSDSDSTDPQTPTTTYSAPTIPDYAGAITEVIPAAFTSSKALSDWNSGDYPLLGKVIGGPECDEPMSLYRNISRVEWNQDLLADVTDEIDWETFDGSYSSTVTTAGPEGQSVTATVSYDLLTEPVQIPASCQTVLGLSSVDIDAVMKCDVPTEGIEYHLGYGSNETAEWMLSWTLESAGQQATEIIYSVHDLATDQYNITCAFYKTMDSQYAEDAIAAWIFEIGTDGDQNSDFVYNMAWYSYGEGDDGSGGPMNIFNCINGAGNKSSRFALRYHLYSGGNWSTIDEGYGPFEQLFGPAYEDLNDQLALYRDDLIDESAMYVFGDMPGGRFDSPYGD